jgi:hypothetical protein
MDKQGAAQSLRKFWVVAELADYLQVRPRWVYEHLRSTSPDPIPHVKLGKYVRINPECSQFKSWLKRRSVVGIDNDE